jgi:hypothetical protein
MKIQNIEYLIDDDIDIVTLGGFLNTLWAMSKQWRREKYLLGKESLPCMYFVNAEGWVYYLTPDANRKHMKNVEGFFGPHQVNATDTMEFAEYIKKKSSEELLIEPPVAVIHSSRNVEFLAAVKLAGYDCRLLC